MSPRFPRCACLVPTQILTSKGISSLRVLFLVYAALQAVLTLVSFLAWPHTFANPLTAPEKLDEAHARVRVRVYVHSMLLSTPAASSHA